MTTPGTATSTALTFALCALAAAGCDRGSSSSKKGSASAAVTTASTTGTVTSVQWAGPLWTGATPGATIADLVEDTASAEVLLASPPSLDVVALGASAQTEMGSAEPVESLTHFGGESYAGTGRAGVLGSGDVYQRGPTGWQQVWDGGHEHVVVTALGADLYAFEGTPGMVPQLSVLSAGQWTSSAALPVDCVAEEAVADGGALWVGASDAAGALLFTGDAAAGFTQVPLPSAALAAGEEEHVTALALDPQGDLLVALAVYDVATGLASRGRVLRGGGQGFTAILDLAADAPLALAVMGTTTFVGTAGGELLDDSAGAGLVADASTPTNLGITRLLASGSTLWVGVLTTQGAQLYSRQVTTVQSGGGTLGFADIQPSLMACAGCHSTLATGYTLSSGLSDPDADYTATRGQVDVGTPDQSALLTKASASVAHSGGSPWPVGSPDYDRVLTWIQQGANLVGAGPSPSAPAPPSIPANPTYVTDARPILLSCATAGCHATRTDYRVSLGLVDNPADYQAALNSIELGSPRSSELLTKPTKGEDHPVKLFDVGSTPYEVLLKWIQQGAPYN